MKITVFAVAAFSAARSSLKRRLARLKEETSDAQATSEDEAGPHTEAIAEDKDTADTPPRSTPAGIG